MFRGANGAGVAETQLPDDLNLEDHLLWRTPVAKGYSSPVVHSGRVFLTAEENAALLTLCLDLETGRELWRAAAPRPRTEKLDHRNHAAAASAAADAESVVVFFGDYGLLCYSHDGRLRWKLPLGPFRNIYGMGASPLLVDGRVILVCDQQDHSFVIAVDAATGQVQWKTDRPDATSGHCTPIVHRPADADEAQILIAGSFYLSAYSVTTGRRLWWVRGLPFEMKSTPVVADGLLFIHGYASPHNQPDKKVHVDSFAAVVAAQDANGDGVLAKEEMPDQLSRAFFEILDLDGDKLLNGREWRYFVSSMESENGMLAMTLGGRGDVTESNLRWKYQKNVPQLPSPVAARGRLYMIDDGGVVTNFEARTGKVSARGRLSGARGSVYASPLIAGTDVLFLTTKGSLAVVPMGESIEVANIVRFNEPAFATPAVARGLLLVRTNAAVYCLGGPRRQAVR